MSLAIAGQIYSENLGDRAIMACADDTLQAHPAVASVHKIDLGGRSDNREKRTGSPSVLVRSHRWAYSRFIAYGSLVNLLRFRSRRRKLRRAFSEQIEKSDAVIIGGGQLLQHSRLQFPLVLREIVRLSEAAGKPVIYWGVGVGSHWSFLSKRLISQALRARCVKKIYVRDSQSHQRLIAQFPDLRMKSDHTCDLAMSISSVIEASPIESRVIGVAPLSPNAVARVEKSSDFADHRFARSFWMEVCESVIERGYVLRLFTTGTNEDLVFCREIIECMGLDNTAIIEHPTTVEEFCDTVSSLEAAITGRLHASILAMSYGKPFQGALWEPKVVGISESTRRQSNFFSSDVDPKDLVERLLGSISASTHITPVDAVEQMANNIVGELQR